MDFNFTSVNTRHGFSLSFPYTVADGKVTGWFVKALEICPVQMCQYQVLASRILYSVIFQANLLLHRKQ